MRQETGRSVPRIHMHAVCPTADGDELTGHRGGLRAEWSGQLTGPGLGAARLTGAGSHNSSLGMAFPPETAVTPSFFRTPQNHFANTSGDTVTPGNMYFRASRTHEFLKN